MLLIIIMIIIFSTDPASSRVFLSAPNINSILANQSVTGILSLAMLVTLVAGFFDLSAAAVTGVASVIVASFTGAHVGNPVLAVAIAICVGAAIGALTGFLIAKVRLDSFIITLGLYILLGGVLVWYTQGQTLPTGSSFSDISSIKIFGIPSPFILLIIVGILVWLFLQHTPFGRYLEAIGSNSNAARLVGINVDRIVWLSFILSGALAALAGCLLASRNGGGDATTGSSYLFPAFAALFLGATAIRPGRFNVWGTIIGVFFLAIAVSGLTLIGASTWVQPVFNGASLVLAVILSTFAARARSRRVVRPADTKS
ncbi:ABC transporter permease [Arthrobacter sp. MI7-26]|uniref:ABC transporter permease n=1 Tax=Arthrobacter sp. MI7-26 TaxID=2993653 RepID=UPI002248C761|nr:ABC transporter permease [Arthrobacter sp. MI7-26]MCX2748094.1 ABC transporter permease [Arthrobacter sp. MI7-26]